MKNKKLASFYAGVVLGLINCPSNFNVFFRQFIQTGDFSDIKIPDGEGFVELAAVDFYGRSFLIIFAVIFIFILFLWNSFEKNAKINQEQKSETDSP